MNAAPASLVHELRPKILQRRARLQAAAGHVSADYVNDLLAEIDATLHKIDNGSYGLCEACHDPIEADLLESNPLVRFCLDHLTPEELRAHEQDLELATQIQSQLLPPRNIAAPGWDTCYRYEPVGVVGGDYCELIPSPSGDGLFFAVGDVAGKGVSASLLMTHLSAIFRSLLSLDLPLADVISRANRLLCESTAAAHYATLVCGRTSANGVDLCNAGHCRPVILRRDGAERLDPSGLPLGLFCSGPYSVTTVEMDEGDSVVLYSDGLTELQDLQGNDYGEDRLIRSLLHHAGGNVKALVDGVLQELARFRGSRRPSDDMTLLVVRRRLS